MTSSYINDGRPRTVTFTHDISGQVIDRDEADNNSNAGDPRAVSYRFGGKEMGSINNDGGFNQNYADSIADRTITPNTSGTGAFRHGDTSGETVTDFDNSYNAINSYGQGSTAGSYVVRGGETLSMIAGQVYGDSSLWYKIAQINGISSPDAALTAGTTLSLPAGVTRSTYNAATFQPYNPGEAIGDVSPTTPEPPKDAGNNCGTFGVILLVVVAVAVTIATQGAAAGFLGTATTASGAAVGGAGTLGGALAGAGAALTGGSLGLTGLTAVGVGAAAGAAGSIASQGVGVATGIQDKFSWKAVGLAAIGGGHGAGIGELAGGAGRIGSALSNGFVRGAVSGALTQGIGVATGLQDSFSWAGGAASSAGAAVGQSVSPVVGQKIGGQLASGGASALASAATRSALDGSNFGDNVIAAIPDVVGQALVNGTIHSAAQKAIGANPSNQADGVNDPGGLGAIVNNFVSQAKGVPGALGNLGGGIPNGVGNTVGRILQSMEPQVQAQQFAGPGLTGLEVQVGDKLMSPQELMKLLNANGNSSGAEDVLFAQIGFGSNRYHEDYQSNKYDWELNLLVDQTPPIRTEGMSDQEFQELLKIETEMKGFVERGRDMGYNVAANHLEYFLYGDGSAVTIDSDWLQQQPEVQLGIETNRHRFARLNAEVWFLNSSPGDTITISDYWDYQIKGKSGGLLGKGSELFYASGDATLTSFGELHLQNVDGNFIGTNNITHKFVDTYDWHDGLGIRSGSTRFFSDSQANALVNAGWAALSR